MSTSMTSRMFSKIHCRTVVAAVPSLTEWLLHWNGVNGLCGDGRTTLGHEYDV